MEETRSGGMSTDQSSAQPKGETSVDGRIDLKAVLRFVIIVLLQPGILFIAAGRINWPMGWAYVVVFIVLTLASRLALMRKHPDLITERARSLERKDVNGLLDRAA